MRAYKEEQTIETVLVTGKVMLNGTTVLQPNQMAIFDCGNRQIKIEEVNADVYRERSRECSCSTTELLTRLCMNSVSGLVSSIALRIVR